MRQAAVLIFCIFLFANCSKVETASSEMVQTNATPKPSVSPAAEINSSLKPVVPNVKLNAKQKKYLNESLPPAVREILEKAEKFEVLAEVRGENEQFEGDGRTFEPTRVAKIAAEQDKKEILEAFYKDASEVDSPAICYEPHHSIRATHQGKTVEVEICFSCSRFIVKGASGEFSGTIVRKNRKSEDVFNRIIESKSVELK